MQQFLKIKNYHFNFEDTLEEEQEKFCDVQIFMKNSKDKIFSKWSFHSALLGPLQIELRRKLYDRNPLCKESGQLSFLIDQEIDPGVMKGFIQLVHGQEFLPDVQNVDDLYFLAELFGINLSFNDQIFKWELEKENLDSTSNEQIKPKFDGNTLKRKNVEMEGADKYSNPEETPTDDKRNIRRLKIDGKEVDFSDKTCKYYGCTFTTNHMRTPTGAIKIHYAAHYKESIWKKFDLKNGDSTCGLCGKLFVTSRNLCSHLVYDHDIINKIDEISIDDWHVKNSTENYLALHFKCDVCGKYMKEQRGVLTHMASLHFKTEILQYTYKGEYVFNEKCKKCDLDIGPKGGAKWLSHFMVKHGVINSILPTNILRQLRCPYKVKQS